MMPTVFPALFAANLDLVHQRLLQLRWVMLLAALLLIVLGQLAGLVLPLLLLGQAWLTLALLNLATPWLAAQGWQVRSLISLGLLADMVVLTEMLAFTGGAANPLASLYLPPVLFGALLLPPARAWALAIISLMAYGLLFVWHLPWPLAGSDAAYAFQLHLVGMWITFAVSVTLLTGFVSYLAWQLSQREAALAAAREAQLRDEQLVALGVQAAGAAHTLSTPLNTLTLLCDDMLASYTTPPALIDDLQLMHSQLAVCRDALARLKAGAESRPAPQPLCEALDERLQGWHSSRPDVKLLRHGLLQGGPLVAFDPRFWPAFFNLLNNAAEAGGGEVELTVASSAGWLTLHIHNRRGSLSDAQLARAGLAPLDSNKPAGLGLGVMLSHVTLSHLGGELNLDNDPQGGVRATLRLPLDTP